eukprot:TRINITY_DN14490_c0_g1_i1.p1 TRINITY_DN14490_c0_g1~~TRINITY_DN14490_c0_g1_i1.p1  ORF type:complete len:380 (-),score=50.45 TRINITY_DN14490_c0_g1_i1:123-1262(-)
MEEQRLAPNLWVWLPSELQQYVFSFIINPQQRLGVALTSTSFAQLARLDEWWCEAVGQQHPTYAKEVQQSKPGNVACYQWYFMLKKAHIGLYATCRVLYDFESSDPHELAVKEGDILNILERDQSGWWMCEKDGDTGLVPAEFVCDVEQSRFVCAVPRANYPSFAHTTNRSPSLHTPTNTPDEWFSPDSALLVIDAVLSGNRCAELIQRTCKMGFYPNFANNDIRALPNPALAAELWEKLHGTFPMQNGAMRAVRVNSHFRFLRYRPEHQPVEHTDGPFADQQAQEASILSLIVYLNDNFAGGQTRFAVNTNCGTGQQTSSASCHDDKLLGAKVTVVQPATGRAVLFPHSWRHSSSPVEQGGTKYILRTDVIYSNPSQA